MIKDCESFLKIIKDLELNLIEFEEDKSIKTRNYLNNYTIYKNICQFVILIAYNKDIFFVNNRI